MSHSQPKRVCPSDPNFEEVVLEWFNAESEGDDDPADSDADAICSEHSSHSEVSSLSSQDEDDQDETFGEHSSHSEVSSLSSQDEDDQDETFGDVHNADDEKDDKKDSILVRVEENKDEYNEDDVNEVINKSNYINIGRYLYVQHEK
ncbi:hypothetical protein FQA39_LY15436 [Lamprigera yunnana]|nr:hypothetical protein FQA39_LY15436 [Lamprigera yunnana]